jgi:DNA (cytosine-5)-methyltransferase 1
MQMAGFTTLWASEFIPAAQQTYRANFPNTHLDTRDIREVSSSEIEDYLLDRGIEELDVFEGSPPCASFSTCGKRDEGWGTVKGYSETKQRTDDLFWEYARLVRAIQPRVFIAENVSGLVRGVAKGYFRDVFKLMTECGYRVEARLIDAQWLGVPQARQRIIFMGVRNDLGVKPAFPKPLAYRYTTSDAIPWLRDPSRQPDPDEARLASIERQAIGTYWDEIAPGETHEKRFNMAKPHPDKPSNTIVASAGKLGLASVVHPFEKRKFTTLELRRLCGFPDDFALVGTYSQQVERLGRSVPPVMMAHIAATIRDEVLAKCAG